MFSVFRGPKYDDIRPNHTKKIKTTQKNKTKKNREAPGGTTLLLRPKRVIKQ